MKYLLNSLLILSCIHAFSQKPIAVDDYYIIDRGENLIFNPIANDSIPNQINLWMLKSPYMIKPEFYNPDHLQSIASHTYLYDPGKYFHGEIIFEYLICDKNNIINTIDTGHIFIMVNNKPLEGYDSLDINKLNVGVVAGGELFTDLWYPHFREKGEKNNVIFRDNLWMGGYDDGGNLRAAAQTYRQQLSYDYEPGSAYGTRNLGFYERYERTWKISKDDLYDHLMNFTNSGYMMNEAIENWPTKGDASNGEPNTLAPFIDFNNNTLYDPEKGDCPCLLGDQMIYLIYNDNITHTETGGESLEFEVHAMVYAFRNDNFPALDNTIFVRYQIINRAYNKEYEKLVFGKWVDFDIGNAYDDLIGCDTNLNAFYSYNGDNFDSAGFGMNPPVIGVSFLNHDMTSFMYYNNDWSLKGNPSEEIHFYYYLTSRYKNGQKLRYGGDGFNDIWVDRDARFMFPSHPNDPDGWSEVTSGNTPSTEGV